MRPRRNRNRSKERPTATISELSVDDLPIGKIEPAEPILEPGREYEFTIHYAFDDNPTPVPVRVGQSYRIRRGKKTVCTGEITSVEPDPDDPEGTLVTGDVQEVFPL